MTSMADWPIVGAPVDPDASERLFFTDHEWETIEAASARIIPTDHDPGAREASVVRFIDHYLCGIEYIFAAGDGSGFLQMSERYADAWRARIAEMQHTYRQGIRQLDALSREQAAADFKDLSEEQQDRVLKLLSGAPKPGSVMAESPSNGGTAAIYAFDDGLPFFTALAVHTRWGFYSDPVYGGNRHRVGWQVIGFPGPESLADTLNGTFSVREYFVHDYDWQDLIPHLRQTARGVGAVDITGSKTT